MHYLVLNHVRIKHVYDLCSRDMFDMSSIRLTEPAATSWKSLPRPRSLNTLE